jgi:hypothetical protein
MWHYPQKPGLQWILSFISQHSAAFQHKNDSEKAGTEAEAETSTRKHALQDMLKMFTT